MTLSRFFFWPKSSPFASSQAKRATQALTVALIHMNEDAAIQAINQGADVNGSLDPPHTSCGRTFLQHAILSVAPLLAEKLLAAGADPMAVSEKGCFWPAPHLATLNEDCDVIDMLRTYPAADFDRSIMDPLVGEASTARDLAVRRGRVFADWFGQRFSLAEAARPPVFENEADMALARWREQRRPRP